jgi:hypothetical protein
MRIKTNLAVLLAAGVTAWAHSAEFSVASSGNGERVVVCMSYTQEADGITVAGAQAITRRMFADIGVDLIWHNSARFCNAHPRQTIVINLVDEAPKTLHPGVLAYALPFERRHINVFYNRVNLWNAVATRNLLARVFAHEITHMLQVLIRHSETGIMKARWDKDDYLHMETRLAFTEEDVRWIHRGLATRTAQPPSETMATVGRLPCAKSDFPGCGSE